LGAGRYPVFVCLLAVCFAGCAQYDDGIQSDDGSLAIRNAVASVLMSVKDGQKVRLYLADGTTGGGSLSEWNYAEVTLSSMGYGGVRQFKSYDFCSIIAAEAYYPSPSQDNLRH